MKYATDLMSKEITLHGTFLNVNGVGVLITGEPGIGKSELALALLYNSHQLIADDCPCFHIMNGQLIGKNPFSDHLLSIRGVGLFNISLLFGSGSIGDSHTLNLIIHLRSGPSHPLTHLEGEVSTKDILGSLIPCVTIPIINPRNLGVLVETIVKVYLLKSNKEMPPVTNFSELLRPKMENDPS